MRATTTMTQEDLGKFLLALYQGTTERPIQSFRQWTLTQLSKVIPFDWACWRYGCIEENSCRIHGAVCYRTPHLQNSMLELADNLPRDSKISSPSQALSLALVISPNGLSSPIPRSHSVNVARNNDEEHALYIVISLYRNDPQAAFTSQERQTAEMIGIHIAESWMIKLQLHLNNDSSPLQSIGEYALCDIQGTLWCAQPQFTELLREEWPEWRGHAVPSDLAKIILRTGSSNLVFDGKRLRCTSSPGPTPDFFYLHVQKQPPLLSLPPRQRRIAIELAQGKTYNQIAHNLGISRSTVTNHANAIYSKLGISNKVQLALLCFGHTLQSLIM